MIEATVSILEDRYLLDSGIVHGEATSKFEIDAINYTENGLVIRKSIECKQQVEDETRGDITIERIFYNLTYIF